VGQRAELADTVDVTEGVMVTVVVGDGDPEAVEEDVADPEKDGDGERDMVTVTVEEGVVEEEGDGERDAELVAELVVDVDGVCVTVGVWDGDAVWVAVAVTVWATVSVVHADSSSTASRAVITGLPGMAPVLIGAAL
jgi:hypothetical protein